MTIIPTDKKMRPRDPNDFYPTPIGHAKEALYLAAKMLDNDPIYILDPGAGSGVWGRAARELWPESCIVGVELRPIEKPSPYTNWHTVDFRLFDAMEESYDFIIGNPPYKYAEAFVRYSLRLLKDGGVLVFLLRLAFLEGQNRGIDLWRKHPPQHIAVCSERPSFTGDNHTDATAYAMFYWKKGSGQNTHLSWLKVSR